MNIMGRPSPVPSLDEMEVDADRSLPEPLSLLNTPGDESGYEAPADTAKIVASV